jgi:hypothetical protein
MMFIAHTISTQQLTFKMGRLVAYIPPELIGKIAPTRLESINLRGVFRFPVDRYADQILPSRPNAPITGTNG